MDVGPHQRRGGEEADQICRLVEKLLTCKAFNTSPAPETVTWLDGLSDDVHQRIADKGLCPPRMPKPKLPTLGEFLAKYLSQRGTDLQPSSIKRLELTQKSLNGHFGDKVRLDSITPDAAADWRARLAAKGLSEATVRLECRNAKSIFAEAVRRELLTRNPF
ncbi:MAG TPA: phage integrase SAM-like domain-containing protein [Pirellulaceae bacterium]|nr:phage integrase SAM-like domain-containing protein [Pirellulaceae bacterium]